MSFSIKIIPTNFHHTFSPFPAKLVEERFDYDRHLHTESVRSEQISDVSGGKHAAYGQRRRGSMENRR